MKTLIFGFIGGLLVYLLFNAGVKETGLRLLTAVIIVIFILLFWYMFEFRKKK